MRLTDDALQRVAARHLLASGYFSEGEEIYFGRYKNKRGKIVRLFVDDRGVPMVEIEPVPKGRKKNRTMGLFTIWKTPEARGVATGKVAMGMSMPVVSRHRDPDRKTEASVGRAGKTPPSNLRIAAERGTRTERRILANAVLAPVFVARTRTWWLQQAPNLYRLARQHEQPRPHVEGLRFPSEMFAVLWYEDEKGNRLPETEEHLRELTTPSGAKYQISQFPTQLVESILQLNDDGTSTEIMRGTSGFPNDLVTQMVRSGEWDVADAIMVAGQSCERCLNVLCHRYNLKDGYPFGSEAYWRAGTSCRMCDHVRTEQQLREATKTHAEREDEKVQKMLRREPKLKPPRYDLRDNRTLDEDDEDPDFKGTGAGDGGDRDLSLKWNKVGHRVMFRWLATRLLTAEERWDPEFRKHVDNRMFTHPDTRNDVVFDSLPYEAQKEEYEKWRGQQQPKEDPDKEDSDKEDPEKEDKKEPERTQEDVEVDLENARDELEDLQDDIEALREKMRDTRSSLKKLKKEYAEEHEDAGPLIQMHMKNQLQERKQELRRMEDELEDKIERAKETKKKVEDLKTERKDPDGAKRRLREEMKKKRREKVRRSVEKTQEMLTELLGPGSDMPKDLQSQLGEQLNAMDDAQMESFSLDFAGRLKSLKEKDPTSSEAIDAANKAAQFGDLHGITDPRELSERLANLTFATNVIANPMSIAGKPVGQTEMDGEAYGNRAHEAFQQFQKLHPVLRRSAVDRLKSELRGLDEDTHRAKELNAILTGMDVAQIADTGEALPGRPQPNKGNAALIKKMVEMGQAERMFKPVEDFFAEDARQTMSDAVNQLTPEEVAELVTGGKKDAGYADLHRLVHDPKTPDVMKEMMKDFLAQDFLNDVWGDRAIRDTMQAAGVADADDPDVRAAILDESKKREAPKRIEALKAKIRIEQAQRTGQRVDQRDLDLVEEYFDPERGGGLKSNVRSLFDVLKDKFKKVVVSPSTAVLNHYVETGDSEVLGQETLPHPDEKAKEPRPKAEREKTRHTPGEQTGVRDEPAPTETPEDMHRKPGEVWRTEGGNWRAKNPEGVPKTFKDRQKADNYAKAKRRREAPAAPARVASTLVDEWFAKARTFHPDDPNRPLIVIAHL